MHHAPRRTSPGTIGERPTTLPVVARKPADKLETMPDPPAIDRLSDVRVPTLILVGNRDVSDIHEICGPLFARIPGAKEIVIQGSGHILNKEQPAQFDRAVLDFLGEVAR